MKIALILLALTVLAIVVAGMLLPREHEASLARHYAAPPADVYALVRAYEHYPQWRTGVKAMQADGAARYIEESRHGRIPYRIEDEHPGAGFVARIDDPGLPFGGTWTFAVRADGDGTELRITERGSVANPVFRLLSRFVFSHEATIRSYLDDVGRKLSVKAVA